MGFWKSDQFAFSFLSNLYQRQLCKVWKWERSFRNIRRSELPDLKNFQFDSFSDISTFKNEYILHNSLKMDCVMYFLESLPLSGISTPRVEDICYKALFILHPKKITLPVDKVRNYKVKKNKRVYSRRSYCIITVPLVYHIRRWRWHLSMVTQLSWI